MYICILFVYSFSALIKTEEVVLLSACGRSLNLLAGLYSTTALDEFLMYRYIWFNRKFLSVTLYFFFGSWHTIYGILIFIHSGYTSTFDLLMFNFDGPGYTSIKSYMNVLPTA